MGACPCIPTSSAAWPSASTPPTEEIVDFAAALIRIPTVNPPGEDYEPCARLIGDRLREFDFEVAYVAAEGRPEHTAAHPRVNVIGRRRGGHPHPLVHLNGHFDVVPAGDGWTRRSVRRPGPRRPPLRPGRRAT